MPQLHGGLMGDADGGYQITNSVRLRAVASAYFSRTFGTPTTQNTFTFSAWVKRSKLAALQNLFGVSTNTSIGFPAADTLVVTIAGTARITTTGLYRDPSAWCHVQYKQTTGAAELYFNGVSVGTSATVSAVFNTAVAHQIGAANTSNYTDGYLADVYFVDGQALSPSSFGQTDSNGVWVPKAYTGTYGANGFHLEFKDASGAQTLGYDTSGAFSLNLRASGTNIGNMTANGGLANGFDGVTVQGFASCPCATGTGNVAATIGKNWGSTKTIQAFRVWTPSDQTGYTNSVTKNVVIKLQGSTDNFGSSIVDLYTSGTIGAIGASATTLVTSGITTSTAYQYHRVLITELSGDGGGHTLFVAEAEFYEAGSYGLNPLTCNVISVTPGVTYDSMVDTPTNNYATLNPIIASAANISYAALRSGTTAVQATEDAAAFTNSGAYWEVTAAGSAVTAGLISGTGTTNTTTVTANKVFGFRLVSGALSYINITDAGSWTSITTGLTGQQFPYGVTQAADWNFGQRPFIGTASGQALCTANLPNGTVTTSGSFTGTLAADGPFVWLNGCPTAMTINGNAVTFGTHADKTAGGFKLRTASASYNNTGSNTYSVSTNAGRFNIPQTAQGNP